MTTLAAFAAAILASACSSSAPPTQPTPSTITVSTVSPAAGLTAGGTPLTITGSGFRAGATVTIGGAVASNVVVQSGTGITATAPPGAAGPADVVVSFGTTQGRLTGGFTYVATAPGPNAAPTVGAITTVGPRPNQPNAMADIGETLSVVVAVTDAETPPSSLTYQWSADVGVTSGGGRAVSWQAPASAAMLPLTATLTVTVIEPWAEIVNGQIVPREHRITRQRTIRVHDSPDEVRTKARQFLLDFSVSSVPVDTVMQNFSPNCGGTAAERADVERNRCLFTIDSYTIGTADPVISFGGTCSAVPLGADACIVIPVRWESTVNPGASSCPNPEGRVPGQKEVAEGLDLVTAIYDNGNWRLCDSRFLSSSATSLRFKK